MKITLAGTVLLLAACSAPAMAPVETPTPTSTPTPMPTAVPDIGQAGWLTFRLHLIASDKKAIVILTAATQSDTSDLVAFSAAWQPMIDWSNDETAWLTAHPEGACYAGTYRSYAAAVAGLGASGEGLQQGIITLNVATITDATAKMRAATAQLRASNDSIPTSNATCGRAGVSLGT
jgi:hypothetical protein